MQAQNLHGYSINQIRQILGDARVPLNCRLLCKYAQDVRVCPHLHSPPPFGDCGAFALQANTPEEAQELLEGLITTRACSVPGNALTHAD